MKISFCTACMGRLHHLKETLPKNIAYNKGADVEFVILDYNSADGVGAWLKENYRREIESGLVVYLAERTARFYNPSHAWNIVHGASSGDIVCKLDADGLTGQRYCDSLAKAFEKERVYVSTRGNPPNSGWIAFRREDFHALRGYDESFVGWGLREVDLVARGLKAGLQAIKIVPRGYGVLHHSEQDRVGLFPESLRDRVATESRNKATVKARQPGALVNPLGYGVAVVYKNLEDHPIEVGWGIPGVQGKGP